MTATANPTDNKNKGYLTLREITPEWFDRLNKILNVNDETSYIRSTLKSTIIKNA